MLALLAQEATEHVESTLEVLPDGTELLFGSIFFVLLLVAMIVLVFPKVRKTMEQRTAKIQGQLEEAERTKREADQILEQYRAQLAEARAEVAKIIEEGKRTADALRTDLVAKAERDAQEIVSRAQTDVAGERDRAIAALKDTLGELSISIASRVLEKELTSSDAHRALVDQAIAQLARSGGSN
jgi:F-type H+-transporting ATPase subunit b